MEHPGLVVKSLILTIPEPEQRHVTRSEVKIVLIRFLQWLRAKLRLHRLTHLFPFLNAPFLYPLKISENCKVFWCFQGVEKGLVHWKQMDHVVRLTIWHHLFLAFWLVDTWFCADWRNQRAVTRLENVRQLNIRQGKKLGFQLSHRQPRIKQTVDIAFGLWI